MSFFDHSIDLILLSHGDADHTGGLKEVLTRYDHDYILAGNWISKESNIKDKENSLVVEEGTRIELEPKIYVDIIGGGKTTKKDNNDSLVARLTYGSTTFLLTGDSTVKEEYQEINNIGKYLHANVLKVSHHGSKTSTSLPFLQVVLPQYAVISVGANNRYGHPNQEILDRLAVISSEILRTDQLGTITFYSDGKNFVKK